MKSTSVLPQHVAIIMDGNGRWAKEKRLPRSQGHVEGVKRVEEIVMVAMELGIRALTLFTFSTENWRRPHHEVAMLMHTLVHVMNTKLDELNANGVKFQIIGKRDGIPDDVLKTFEWAIEKTKNNSRLVLNLAFNYGGRQEIVEAIKNIARKVRQGELQAEEITEETVDRSLYTAGLPDPDLLIRTSGEKRISNFLLWQLSYAEFYFSDKYWPDFTGSEFRKAIKDFRSRERRFGDVKEVAI